MTIETTLILCKPDAVARGLVGDIVGRIERRGYVVTAMKLTQIDGDQARAHYAEHKDKPFFGDLVGFITSGPLVALAVEGINAIGGCRQIVGATDPLAAAPGSIRGDLAQTIGRNLVHGSDSPESAKRELKIFFKEGDFVSRRHDLDRWIKD
ncbi:MAG: nucleoside-diphosphate kinase [Vulcanimicrobiaceae bacterium]